MNHVKLGAGYELTINEDGVSGFITYTGAARLEGDYAATLLRGAGYDGEIQGWYGDAHHMRATVQDLTRR